MVRLRAYLLAGKEGRLVLGVRGHGQVALAHVDTHDALLGLWQRISHLKLQAHQQIDLLAGLVIPELGRADVRGLSHECHVPGLARVGEDHAPVQRQHAHPLLTQPSG